MLPFTPAQSQFHVDVLGKPVKEYGPAQLLTLTFSRLPVALSTLPLVMQYFKRNSRHALGKALLQRNGRQRKYFHFPSKSVHLI